MEHEDETIARLHHLGTRPVDPSIAERHIAAIAKTRTSSRPWLARAGAVAAAVLAALAVPAAAIAVAGRDSSPGPVVPGAPVQATEDASDATESSETDEPDGPKDNHGQCVREVAHATPPGPGHGQIVSEAARTTCRDQAGGGGETTADPPGPPVDDGDVCTGPPPWAGNPGPKGETPEEREAIRAQRQAEKDEHRAAQAAAGCPVDETETEDEKETEAESS